jgi:hypothetical protein
MRRLCLIFSVVLVAFAGCSQAASAGRFRFQDLEYYYLHYYLPPASDDPEQTQLKNYAVKYAEAHFPLGSSASAAVSALTMAGAKCSVGDDPNEPPALICDWSRPSYGLDYFCCQIDWMAVLVTDKKYVTIQDIWMSRTESGP